MIYDVNIAIGHWPFRNLRFTDRPCQLFSHLKAHGIGAGIVRSYEAPFCADLEYVNGRLYDACADTSFTAAPAVRPDYGAWKEIHASVVSLYPSFHCYGLTDERTIAMAKSLATRSIDMLVVMREEDERVQNPLCKVPPVPAEDINALAEAVPEARIIVINGSQPEITAFKEPNILADFAYAEGFPCLQSLLTAFPVNRLVFGSNTPMFYTTAALNKLKDAELTPKQYDAITCGNALHKK